jgi:hypothetical protein
LAPDAIFFAFEGAGDCSAGAVSLLAFVLLGFLGTLKSD